MVRGRTRRRVNVHAEKVKGLWFDCEVWAELGLEDDYQVMKGKIEDRQQWDHRNLLDTVGEDRMVGWRLEVSGGSEPGFGAQSRGDLDCPGSVERLVCCPLVGVAQWGGCGEG